MWEKVRKGREGNLDESITVHTAAKKQNTLLKNAKLARAV
jgi:hypothetical protein